MGPYGCKMAKRGLAVAWDPSFRKANRAAGAGPPAWPAGVLSFGGACPGSGRAQEGDIRARGLWTPGTKGDPIGVADLVVGLAIRRNILLSEADLARVKAEGRSPSTMRSYPKLAALPHRRHATVRSSVPGVPSRYFDARTSTFRTEDEPHTPPRAVRTPRAFRLAAISRSEVRPADWISRMIGRMLAAN
jgi:hypothetical protein